MGKRRPGRPKVESRKQSFSIVMEPEKMDIFDTLAIADDKTRSQKVRELIVDEIERRSKEQ